MPDWPQFACNFATSKVPSGTSGQSTVTHNPNPSHPAGARVGCTPFRIVARRRWQPAGPSPSRAARSSTVSKTNGRHGHPAPAAIAGTCSTTDTQSRTSAATGPESQPCLIAFCLKGALNHATERMDEEDAEQIRGAPARMSSLVARLMSPVLVQPRHGVGLV